MFRHYMIGLLCSMTGCVPVAVESSSNVQVTNEMFPGASEVLGSDSPEIRGQILERLGIRDGNPAHAAAVGPVSVRNLDLDSDGCDDSLVTVRVEGPAGARGRQRTNLTYVFKGKHKGAFRDYRNSPTWFAVVTYDSICHVDYDQETHRGFRIQKKSDQWSVTIEEYRYGNNGGEASERLMSFRGHSSVQKSLPEASRDGEADARRIVRELNLDR